MFCVPDMRTRVKICGITRVEDALAAVASGADAIGLVFYAPSPRHVTINQAAEIVNALPPFITVVALFVDADKSEIDAVLSNVNVDLLQFHGDEPEEVCRQFDLPYLKAIRVKQDTNLIQYAQTYHTASAMLLDTYVEGAVGGTGQVFDWSLIPNNLPLPIILAGGLTPGNVAKAIEQVQPYAVDVSGGVEAGKGIKDPAKIAALMAVID